MAWQVCSRYIIVIFMKKDAVEYTQRFWCMRSDGQITHGPEYSKYYFNGWVQPQYNHQLDYDYKYVETTYP